VPQAENCFVRKPKKKSHKKVTFWIVNCKIKIVPESTQTDDLTLGMVFGGGKEKPLEFLPTFFFVNFLSLLARLTMVL
jgi:hypothetical protein